MKKITLKIKHVDGITDVVATGIVPTKGDINLNYRFQGMDYGYTITLPELINMGVITQVRANNSFREMEEGKIYKIEGLDIDNITGNPGISIKISVGTFHHSNFGAA